MNILMSAVVKFREKENFTVIVIYVLLLASVLAESLFLAILLTLLLLLALVIFKNSILGFYLGVFSLSFDQIFIPNIFSLKIHMLVFLATSLAFVYTDLRERRTLNILPKSLFIPLVSLFVFSLMSTFFAEDRVLALRFLGALIYAFAIFVITFTFISKKDRVLKTILFLFGGAVISSITAIYQFVAFYFDINFFRKINILNPGNFARPKGLFDHTNFLANFFLASVPILIAYTLLVKKVGRVLFFLIGFSIASLVITFSRAAYAGFFISLITIFFFSFKYRAVLIGSKRALRIIFVLVPILAALLFIIGPLRPGFTPVSKKDKPVNEKQQQEILVERIGSSIDPEAVTNIERIQIWKSGINMFEDNWLTGVGLENFKLRYKEYKLPEAKRSQVSAHNSYLQLGVETGILGLSSFVWFGIALVMNSFRGIIRTKDYLLRALLVGALAAVFGVTFQNLTNSVFYYAHTWFLYGFLAAATSLALNKK